MIVTKSAPPLTTVARKLPTVFEAATRATRLLAKAWNPDRGTPVYTEAGVYTTRGWTEWTQGFQFGNALYLYEATGDTNLLAFGRKGTIDQMASHVSHIGVHDHGFNNVSTYGNLLRLMAEGRIPHNDWEAEFYRLALKVSGAIQAARWTNITAPTGWPAMGYIHSFNGAHSLFADTIRSLRALALAHQLGHQLMGEQDSRVKLLERIIQHAEATARYNVYFGKGRDSWDIRGRVVHESIFNTRNGAYRCPSTQQGYSPFTTWTRGLAWIICGFAEELEWLASRPDSDFSVLNAGQSRTAIESRWLQTACATADFHIASTPVDGIPYWDTGAPGLVHLGDYLNRPAEPFNQHEPVDSSAAAISAQGLWRLGCFMDSHAERLQSQTLDLDGSGTRMHPAAAIRERATGYQAAALVTADSLFTEPYLSTGPEHQGILLHAIYHQPNGWDHVPAGSRVAHGESCLWGDYHLLELAVMLQRAAAGQQAQRFFDIDTGDPVTVVQP